MKALAGAQPAYDAVAKDWFDNPEAVQAALASPEGQGGALTNLGIALVEVRRFARRSPPGRTPPRSSG
jgi:hypothetical protein